MCKITDIIELLQFWDKNKKYPNALNGIMPQNCMYMHVKYWFHIKYLKIEK